MGLVGVIEFTRPVQLYHKGDQGFHWFNKDVKKKTFKLVERFHLDQSTCENRKDHYRLKNLCGWFSKSSKSAINVKPFVPDTSVSMFTRLLAKCSMFSSMSMKAQAKVNNSNEREKEKDPKRFEVQMV